jgi:hypothetical protein
MPHDSALTIVVNLEERTVLAQTVTFDQIVRLAFPEKADDPTVTFKVTYRKAEGGHHDGPWSKKTRSR